MDMRRWRSLGGVRGDDKRGNKMINRYKFSEIFKKNFDGSLSPIKTISVNGIVFGQGISFSNGVSFGGVNFFLYQNNDIAAEEENGILQIRGFYN